MAGPAVIIHPAQAVCHQAENGTQTLHLSDMGGLSQFGAFRETLPPGAASSRRHWHASEDEFLYAVDGTATIADDDGPHPLSPGDAACWRHGDPNGHHVLNRSAAPCSCLIVGSRRPSDRVLCSDIDKIYIRENGVVRRTKRDGSPWHLR